MNFPAIPKPPTSGDQREMYRWQYLICEVLNGLRAIFLDHKDTQGLELADDTSADDTGYKHVTDAQIKVYGDHVRVTDGNPHGTDHSMLGGIAGSGVNHISVAENAEISAIDALGNGMVAKTGDAAYTARTITGTLGKVTVTNGNGVAGNPVISLPAVITTPISFGDGTNQTTIEADGTVKYEGGATVWNDINLSISSLRSGVSAPGAWTITGTGIILPTFGGSGPQQDAYGSLEILHDYKEGSDIFPHIHWCPTTTGAGNVVWQLEYSWANGGGTVTTSTTITVTVAANGVVAKEERTNFPTISGAGKTIGSRFLFHLFRNSAHASDTYGSDAAAFDFGIHYERDTTGSRQITTK